MPAAGGLPGRRARRIEDRLAADDDADVGVPGFDVDRGAAPTSADAIARIDGIGHGVSLVRTVTWPGDQRRSRVPAPPRSRAPATP